MVRISVGLEHIGEELGHGIGIASGQARLQFSNGRVLLLGRFSECLLLGLKGGPSIREAPLTVRLALGVLCKSLLVLSVSCLDRLLASPLGSRFQGTQSA